MQTLEPFEHIWKRIFPIKFYHTCKCIWQSLGEEVTRRFFLILYVNLWPLGARVGPFFTPGTWSEEFRLEMILYNKNMKPLGFRVSDNKIFIQPSIPIFAMLEEVYPRIIPV